MMFTIETTITFFAASILLALSPGPDNLFVLTQSALRGRSAGMMVTLGLCTGLVGHSLAVALGVAVIFQTSAVAFSVLKFIGAGYLVYLAVKAFRASAETIRGGDRVEAGYGRLYARGIIMNITNPKVSIFFLAFLPQFADPSRGPLTLQLLLLGSFFILSTVVVFGGIALLAGTLGQWLSRSERALSVMNKVAGIVFVGLALKLVTARR
jgi:threonine/homoserine/homoserine lactone efflux protein